LRLFLKAVEQDNDVAVIENEESSIDVAIARGSHLVNALAYMLDELHADAFTRFQHIKHVCELLLRPCVKGIEEVDEVVLVIQQPSLLSYGAKVAISFYIWKLCKGKESQSLRF